jgi:hypothetical protein
MHCSVREEREREREREYANFILYIRGFFLSLPTAYCTHFNRRAEFMQITGT